MLNAILLSFGILSASITPTAYEQALSHLSAHEDVRAYETVEEAADHKSTDPNVYLLKGSIERQKGELDAAAASFRAGLRASPRHPDLNLELGITLWWMGRHAEALESLDIAVDVTPERAAAWETRGRILLSLDRRNEAESSLQRAIDLEPSSAGPFAALGTVHRSRADKKDARLAYEKALALEPGNKEATDGIEALKQLHLWTLETSLRAFKIQGQMVKPGGELMLRRQWGASTFTHFRATHEVRSWRNQASIGVPTETDVMSRGEVGVLFEPIKNLKLLPAYVITHSKLPLHHAASLEVSLLVHKTVLLGSARPGISGSGAKDVASQLGVQQIFGKSAWAMVQVFDYRNELKQNSATFVATVSVNPGKYQLKAGGGLGKYMPGLGYPVFGSLGYAFSPAVTIRAEYNYFGGFVTQHQLGLTGVWGF